MQIVWNSWEIHGKIPFLGFIAISPEAPRQCFDSLVTVHSGQRLDGMNAKEDGFGFKLHLRRIYSHFKKHLWIWNEMILVPYNCLSVLRQGRTWLYYIDMCVVFLRMLPLTRLKAKIHSSCFAHDHCQFFSKWFFVIHLSLSYPDSGLYEFELVIGCDKFFKTCWPCYGI